MNSITNDLIVHTFPCLEDNYGFLIHDPISLETACIDTPDANEIDKQLQIKEWGLTKILNTHNHMDHVGGNLQLKEKYDCEIIASEYDKHRTPGITQTVKEGDHINIGDHITTVFETPGHTLGHIIYYFEQQKLLFVGDTLFALGCGRLFEGSAEQMFASLAKIKSLPDDITVHCAHEYTEANADFIISLNLQTDKFKERYKKIVSLRKQKLPTIPFILGEDKTTNPFLLANTASEFANYRKQKDNF